nr:hypothetical protein CFP56_71886 [Quercus suber]
MQSMYSTATGKKILGSMMLCIIRYAGVEGRISFGGISPRTVLIIRGECRSRSHISVVYITSDLGRDCTRKIACTLAANNRDDARQTAFENVEFRSGVWTLLSCGRARLRQVELKLETDTRPLPLSFFVRILKHPKDSNCCRADTSDAAYN